VGSSSLLLEVDNLFTEGGVFIREVSVLVRGFTNIVVPSFTIFVHLL
jgi:hypothetical protein